MKTLAIDIETYSSADLRKTGVYKYVEAPDFEILLFAFKIDNEVDIPCYDFSKERIDRFIFDALTDPSVLKTAFNANFERTCIAKYFGIELPPEQWECTMVKGAMLGLPLSLDVVGKVLKLETRKDAKGKALIKYFSMPCKPTKANGQRTRNLPEHDPEKWQEFIDYCVKDVEVEQAEREKISFFTIPDIERELWCLDQRINDTGVMLSPAFIQNAITMNAEYKARLLAEAASLTGMDNPNSGPQLIKWLNEETEIDVNNVRKETVEDLKYHPLLSGLPNKEVIQRVLSIKQQTGKSSISKYEKMLHARQADGRIRGLVQFYGANRTGRWAGRAVQVQNLPKNFLKDLDTARQVVLQNNLYLLEFLYGNVPDTISQLIRTAFVAAPGHRFIVADFAAIEARVIAWLAGEKWALEVFATTGKIYEATAAKMFKIPFDTIVKGHENYRYRAYGKVGTLSCGYQGSVGALIRMGALREGIPEDFLPEIVSGWRSENRNIVKFWYDCEAAAVRAVKGETVRLNHGIVFYKAKGILFVRLPSGRELAYAAAEITINKFGKEAVRYQGMGQEAAKAKVWGWQDAYGGKWAENITQAVARDCLAYALIKVDAAGYDIAMHIHDEIVTEVATDFGSLEELNSIMGQPIPWAPGLPLTAESYETLYYKKD